MRAWDRISSSEIAAEVQALTPPQLSEKWQVVWAFGNDVIARSRFHQSYQPSPREGGYNWMTIDVPPSGRLTLQLDAIRKNPPRQATQRIRVTECLSQFSC